MYYAKTIITVMFCMQVYCMTVAHQGFSIASKHEPGNADMAPALLRGIVLEPLWNALDKKHSTKVVHTTGTCMFQHMARCG